MAILLRHSLRWKTAKTGKLHLIDDVCALSFADDLDYWRTW